MKTPVVSPLRNASTTGRLRINYSPTLALYRVEEDARRNTNPVFQVKAKDKFITAKPDELRWRVVTNTSHKALPLSTQKNRLRRRWAAAFQQSLKRQGLGHNGKRQASDQMQMLHTPEIAGTLELVIFEGYGWEESADELLSDTNHVVQALLKAGEGTKRTKPKHQDTRCQKGEGRR